MTPLERRFRSAGLAIILGLAVQALTLVWSHPLAFLAFLGLGVPLTALGILLYLWALVSERGREPAG